MRVVIDGRGEWKTARDRYPPISKYSKLSDLKSQNPTTIKLSELNVKKQQVDGN